MFYVLSYSKAQKFWELKSYKSWRLEQYAVLSCNDGRPYLSPFSADEKIHVKKNWIRLFVKRHTTCKCEETFVVNVNKKVQLDATVCRHLFTAKSLYMFRVSQHPSPGALKTVTATSGIGHNTGTATSFQRGLRKEVAVPVLWPIPEVAVTDFSAPDDGCCDTRNM